MNERTGTKLFRCVSDGLPHTGELGSPNCIAYESGKVYSSGSEPATLKPGQFKEVDAPPECLSTSFEKVVERCNAFIEWMKGPVARDLDWEVREDHKVRTPAGDLVRVANRPVSASELVKPRIGMLKNAALSEGVPFEKPEVKAVDCLYKAINLVTRLRDWAERIEKQT